MGRGFLSGIFWGGITGTVLLGGASQMLDRQDLSLPKPKASPVEVPGGTEFDQARPETEPVLPRPEARPDTLVSAGVAVPDDTNDTPPALDDTALQVPVPATTQDAPETLGNAPETVADAETPAPATDAAVEPAVAEALETPDNPGNAPAARVEEPEAVTTEVEVEEAPEIAEASDTAVNTEDRAVVLPAAEDSVVQPGPEAVPQVAGQMDAPESMAAPAANERPPLPWEVALNEARVDQAPNAPALPSVTSEPSLPPAGTAAPQAPVVEAPNTPVVVETPKPAPVEAPEPAPVVTPEPEVVETPEPAPVTEPAAREETVVANAEAEAEAEADSSLPVVRRLGNSEAEADAVPEVEDQPAEEVVPADAEAEPEAPVGPALQAFSSEFENVDALPLLTFVLLHDAGNAVSADALAELPEHVAFAVDAGAGDAEKIAAFYRENGREVVMIPSLPVGATAQDVEQALAYNFARIPEAVAVMDVGGSSFQSDRTAVAQVVEVIADTGHGLITFPRGLNAAHQQAQRSGVATGLIFRNLDENDGDQEQIRRSMDRAAFRARQEEAVILVGTGSGATLAALADWVGGNRAATVAIAPVSAALGGL